MTTSSLIFRLVFIAVFIIGSVRAGTAAIDSMQSVKQQHQMRLDELQTDP